MYDTLILGGGPAGVSAALTLLRRGRSAAVLSLPIGDNPLCLAKEVRNYPGLFCVSGAELLHRMEKQTREAGCEWIRGRATSILPLGESFGIGAGAEFYEARSVILATGIDYRGAFLGERELLGRGVSYCVTCDGMLYRGRRTAVLGFTTESENEAELLRSFGCEVTLFTRPGKYEILGRERVEGLKTPEGEIACDAVFILRAASAPDTLLPGLAMDGVHVRTDRNMATSVPGAFACGDCTGEPYQIAKAVGEGNVAALSCDAFLRR